MSIRRRVRRTNANRGGFTLMELMLVMAILVVLATMSTVAVMQFQGTSNNRSARIEIETMKRACKFYRINTGAYPNKLEDLVMMPSGMTAATWQGPYLDGRTTLPLDPWKRAFNYSIDTNRDQVIIASAGKDGQIGSADDIPGPETN